MKQKLFLVFFITIIAVTTNNLFAQNVGIGTTSPSEKLQVAGNVKADTLKANNSIKLTSGAGSSKVLTSDASGNATWQTLSASSINGWGITGNAGTNSSTNFIGTTDNQSLQLRINNQFAGLLDSVSHDSFFGYGSGVISTGNNNSALGYKSFNANTTGTRNVAAGAFTLNANTTGNDNVALGHNSQKSNNTGTGNISAGTGSLINNIQGSFNVAIGHQSLSADSSGNGNTAVGKLSLNANYTGYSNVAVGIAALNNNVDRNNLVAVGDSALFNNGNNEVFALDAYANTAIGSKALFHNSIGSYNTAVGNNALFHNTIAIANTANGHNALFNNTIGSNNTATGEAALLTNTIGGQNTATGQNSLQGNTTGNYNAAHGYQALYSNTSGSYNTADGSGGLYNNISGSSNTAIGNVALLANSTGHSNVAIGVAALYNATASSNLVAIGDSALFWASADGGSTAIGSKALFNSTNLGLLGVNTAVGYQALYNSIDGNSNTAVGYQAGIGINHGSGNTFIGELTANINDGGENTAIGYVAGLNPLVSFSTCIGANSFVTSNHTVVLGGATVTTIGGFANWSNFSDGRFKENINTNVPGLDFILKLNPVTYTLNTKKIDEYSRQMLPASSRIRSMQPDSLYQNASAIVHTGFIAQDVESVANQLGYNFDGVNKPQNASDHYSIAYGQFVMPIVKGMQEEQKEIETLEKENELLKQQNAEMLKRLEYLEKKNK